MWEGFNAGFIDYKMVIALAQKQLADILKNGPTSLDSFARYAAARASKRGQTEHEK